MGRSPQIIEDQVTFPIVSGLQGLPHVKAVRATSMFGMSFVFVIFEDGVDTYFARTRVLERMNTIQAQLPSGVVPSLGPDGTGVGHVYWYTVEGKGFDLGAFVQFKIGISVTNFLQLTALQKLQASADLLNNIKLMLTQLISALTI